MNAMRLFASDKSFVEEGKLSRPIRLPLEGRYTLTYRCNNSCRHCWIGIPADSPHGNDELTFSEIKAIVAEARSMGCRKWSLTGGEPMLRPDFCDIFDCATFGGAAYVLNTNGTLITPKISRLLRRRGITLVSLYGATADVHDHITRRLGSFAEAMQGIAYLKEGGVNFIVQLMPMRDNVHQFAAMVKLGKSLSKHYRLGGTWLYLSAQRDKARNEEIKRQRLLPETAIELDEPWVSCNNVSRKSNPPILPGKLEYFFSCALSRNSFSLDPYGRVSFCGYVQDPQLLCDVRKGGFRQAWEEKIPAFSRKIVCSQEYEKECGPCPNKKQCKWCPVYAYLEHGDYAKKIDYLCALAKEKKMYDKKWLSSHRRFYQVAGITLQVVSDAPIKEQTFEKKFALFETNKPTNDRVFIRHHRGIPRIQRGRLGALVQCSAIYEIFRNERSWTYVRFSKTKRYRRIYYLAVCDLSHSAIDLYFWNKRETKKLSSLTFPPTDRALLAYLLAERKGCILHASGINLNGRGLIFLGPSGAGKSTIAKMLAPKAEVLCDESIIVRKQEKDFFIYGNWCHGTFKQVSAGSAPLSGVFLLKKSLENRVDALYNKKEIIAALLRTVNRSLMTGEWWRETLDTLEDLSNQVPFYRLRFDKSGEAAEILEKIH